jgi:hypothetical protein
VIIIMLNPDNIFTVSTIIHEFGHWIERRLKTPQKLDRNKREAYITVFKEEPI